LVQGIEYRVNDPEFNEVKYDYRGNPAFSTMISKLCEYNRRSEFILHVLTTLLAQQDDGLRQVMILAHNRCLLTYLHDAIVHRGIAAVGYYVGGMKESALKETESKQVVLATYSMASEGLDIKTLTTLIMATPKTDIQQSVGRILRDKDSRPVVVDIIDSHSLFQNQWAKRKQFYRKEKYRIVHTTSDAYSSDPIHCWNTVTSSRKRAASKSVAHESVCAAAASMDDENENEEEEDDLGLDLDTAMGESAKRIKVSASSSDDTLFPSGKCMLPLPIRQKN